MKGKQGSKKMGERTRSGRSQGEAAEPPRSPVPAVAHVGNQRRPTLNMGMSGRRLSVEEEYKELTNRRKKTADNGRRTTEQGGVNGIQASLSGLSMNGKLLKRGKSEMEEHESDSDEVDSGEEMDLVMEMVEGRFGDWSSSEEEGGG